MVRPILSHRAPVRVHPWDMETIWAVICAKISQKLSKHPQKARDFADFLSYRVRGGTKIAVFCQNGGELSGGYD
jgi:hypothetical protein